MIKIIDKEYSFGDIREGELFLYGKFLCLKKTHLSPDNNIKNTIPVRNFYSDSLYEKQQPFNLKDDQEVQKITGITIEV